MAIVFSQSNFLFYTLKELKKIEEIMLAKVSKADVCFIFIKIFDSLESLRWIFSVENISFVNT